MLNRRSNFALQVLDILKQMFPYFTIIEEFYVNYNGFKLFFDFYIKELDLFIEVQGSQHFIFNKFFHQDEDRFLKQKRLDKLKAEWADLNNHNLIYILPNETPTPELIMRKIRDGAKY